MAEGDFLGDNVTLTLHDERDDTTYAALNHGHFGVKLHRKDQVISPGRKLPHPPIRQSLTALLILMAGESR